MKRLHLDRSARRALGFATIATGVTIAFATLGRPEVALASGALAAAAALAVLQHLLNREETRS